MSLDDIPGRFFAYAAWISIAVALLIVGYVQLSGAVDLSIVGHVSGQGYQNLSYVGDTLNVSILQNGTGWNISLLGGSA